MENNFVPPVQPPQPEPAPVHPKKGLCVASLVLGIVALVFSCVPYLAIPCGVVGLILGILANKAGKNGMATAGIIMSIIGLAFSVLMIVALASWLATFLPWMSEFNYTY